MGFGDAVKTCFSKFFVGEGRASRPEYWWFFLAYIVLYAIAAAIDAALETGFVLAGIVGLVFFIPLITAAIRRLHDTGRSGWWYLIVFIPLVGFIILIVFLATEGQPGQNEYGPPPGGAAMGGATPPPPPPAPA
jgi:uncharacterized membrane protein YhaH (DUF805 family)